MKKFVFLTLVAFAWLFPYAASAQTVVTTPAYIVFTAQTNEIFTVYVDGIPYGNTTYNNTQQQVTISNLPLGVHSVTVRLIRPTDRVANISIDYQQQSGYFIVSYDATTSLLSILTEANIPLPSVVTPITPVTPITNTPIVTPVTPTPGVAVMPPYGNRHIASDADVYGIIERLKKTSFENDKLQLSKSFVKGKHVTTEQAVLIAKSLRFESKRLEFLIYTYDYCIDRENYYTAADILSFNSNKQKLLKRIQHSGPNSRTRSRYR